MWGLTPFFDLTHKYTGEQGLNDSPRMPVCLDFRSLAEGHRSLSEQRIIATNPRPSTIKFNYLRRCGGLCRESIGEAANKMLSICFQRNIKSN